MLSTKLFKHSTLYLISGLAIMGCQHKPSPPPPESVVEAPQFPITTYPMVVKGQRFIIDVPWDDKQDLQQQQDAIFTSVNESEKDRKSVQKYVKVEKSTNENSQYVLRSGLKVEALEHDFDTFLQFTLATNCKRTQTKLRCEFNAIDGIYSLDLPKSMSLSAEQTPAQMEKNEIDTLSKLIKHPLSVTETFKTPLSLSKLKTKLVQQHFLVDSKKDNLFLSRQQYNYEVELTQEKIKKQYEVTVRYIIYPTSLGAYHADYVTPLNLAKKDFKKSIDQ